MNGKYSYADIAAEDLLAARQMLKAKLYNHASRLCQQYIEKVLKQCIHERGCNETDMLLMHSHKLVRIAARCAELCGFVFSRDDTAFFRELTDYYFDTNYPGENYIQVSEHEAHQAYEKTLAFQASYESTLCQA